MWPPIRVGAAGRDESYVMSRTILLTIPSSDGEMNLSRALRCKALPASRQGLRASLGIHGPDRTAALIHCAIGDISKSRGMY